MAQTLISDSGLSVAPTSNQNPKRLSTLGKIARGVLGFLILAIILELAIRGSGIPENEMPRVQTILGRMFTLIVDVTFLGALGSTLLVTFSGLAIATIIASTLR